MSAAGYKIMEKENYHIYFNTRCRYEFCWEIKKFTSFCGILESEIIDFDPVCSSKWKLVLCCTDDKRMKFGLQRNDRNTHVVQLKVHFALRNSKETPLVVETLVDVFTWTDEIKYYSEYLTKPTTERNNKFRLCKDDVLTIDGYIIPYCCLQRARSGLEDISLVQEYLESLLSDEKYSDVKLLAEKNSFLAHKFVLASRSSTLEKLLKTHNDAVDSNCVNFKLDKAVLLAFLKFVYTGVLEQLDVVQTLACYGVAWECGLADLLDVCRDRLCSSLSESNVCKILIAAQEFKDEALIENATSFLCRNFYSVPKEEWEKFVKSKSDVVSDIMIRIQSNVF